MLSLSKEQKNESYDSDTFILTKVDDRFIVQYYVWESGEKDERVISEQIEICDTNEQLLEIILPLWNGNKEYKVEIVDCD